MIVPETEKTIISSGISGAQEYKILANSKMMNILSNNIYSNKVRAVMRELSTNAYDSHVAAGNKHLPFDVYLPTDLDLTFKIRDYGTGLSPENVIQLYSTYGSSNKTNSNEFVGFMGLGSKSPFSIVSTFTTISYFNGKKYTFINYKNEQDIPSISLMSEIDTDEPNGIEISMLVSKDLSWQFISEKEYVFLPFDVRPNIWVKSSNTFFSENKGYNKITFNDYIVNRDFPHINFILTKGSFYNSFKSFLVKMGNVFYQIPREYTPHSDYFSGFSKKNTNQSLVYAFIEVDIGDIDVSTSREEIQKTSRTEKVIKQKISNFYAGRVREIEKIYKECKNPLEITMKISVLPENVLNEPFFKEHFENHPSRDLDVKISHFDFKAHRKFNFNILSKKDCLTDTLVSENTLFVKNLTVMREIDKKPIYPLNFTKNSVTLRYSCDKYFGDYYDKRDSLDNLLIVVRDEKGIQSRINSVISNYIAAVIVDSESVAKQVEEYLHDKLFYNTEVLKLSQITTKIKSPPRAKKDDLNKTFKFIYSLGRFPSSYKEINSWITAESLKDIPDGNTVLYLSIDPKTSSIKDGPIFATTSFAFNNSRPILEYVSLFTGISKDKIHHNILVVSQNTGLSFVKDPENNKRINFLNLWSVFENNKELIKKTLTFSNFLSPISAEPRQIEEIISSFEKAFPQEDMSAFKDMLNWLKKYIILANLSYNFSTLLNITHDIEETLRQNYFSDQDLVSKLEKLKEFKDRLFRISSVKNHIKNMFSTFDIENCAEFIALKNVLISLVK